MPYEQPSRRRRDGTPAPSMTAQSVPPTFPRRSPPGSRRSAPPPPLPRRDPSHSITTSAPFSAASIITPIIDFPFTRRSSRLKKTSHEKLGCGGYQERRRTGVKTEFVDNPGAALDHGLLRIPIRGPNLPRVRVTAVRAALIPDAPSGVLPAPQGVMANRLPESSSTTPLSSRARRYSIRAATGKPDSREISSI